MRYLSVSAGKLSGCSVEGLPSDPQNAAQLDIRDRMIIASSKLWLPFTQMQHFNARPREFVRAEGTLLFDSEGHALYDAVSSIWTIVHGHCHPLISEAIASQARRLDHATMLGATNPLAIGLRSGSAS